MKKFLRKIIFYSVICLLLLEAISFTSLYFLKNASFYKPSYLLNNYKPNDEIDYIILGSSRGLTTLNTNSIDKNLNTKGINLSMDDTDLKTHLLMFKHFVNNGYKTKHCILTLDKQNFKQTSKTLGNNDYRFIPFSNSYYVKEHYKSYETNRLKLLYNSFWNPILALSYFNLELLPPSIISLLKPKFRNRFDTTGNYTYPNSKKISIHKKINTLNKTITNPLINELNNICIEHNIKLHIYIAPYYKKNINLYKSNYSIINHSNITKNHLYFYDNIHVNKNGREFVTEAFTKEFKKQLY